MQIKFQIFDDKQLLIQKFSGTFSLDIYTTYTGFLTQNFDLSHVTKVLIDFRNINFDNKLPGLKQEVNKVADFRKKIEHKDMKRANVKRLFWVDKPLPTVVVQMFLRKSNSQSHSFCSSLKSALLYLDLKNDEIDLENLIKNLEHIYCIDS